LSFGKNKRKMYKKIKKFFVSLWQSFDNSKLFFTILIQLFLLQIADFATTMTCLYLGFGEEINPFAKVLFKANQWEMAFILKMLASMLAITCFAIPFLFMKEKTPEKTALKKKLTTLFVCFLYIFYMQVVLSNTSIIAFGMFYAIH
jgi:hypothetical protein